MSYEVKEKTNTKVVFQSKNTGEEIEKAKRSAYKKLAGKVNVPGFRKGKAPYEIGARFVGESRLLEEALDELMQKDLDEFLAKEKINPITRPDVKLDKLDENEVVLTFTVEFLPDVDVEVPEKIDVILDLNEVDKEVEKKLKDLQDTFTEVKEVDRAAKEGDLVDVQYKINEVKDADWKDVTLEVGKKQFVGDFDEQIVGKKAGDTFEVKSDNMTVQVKVVAVKEKKVPEIGDELAKDAGFDNLEEMKKSIREEALKNKETQLEESKGNEALEVLADKLDVELPEKLVKEETESRFKDLENQYLKHGIKLTDAFKDAPDKLEELKEGIRKSVIKDIKKDLIIRAIIKKEDIKVTDDEIKAEFDRFVKEQNITSKNIKLSEDVKSIIEDQLLRNKAISFLKDRAIIKEEKVNEEKTEEEEKKKQETKGDE